MLTGKILIPTYEWNWDKNFCLEKRENENKKKESRRKKWAAGIETRSGVKVMVGKNRRAHCR